MRRLPLRSPPRMRGKAGFLRASSFLTGITPAYAGKRRQAGNPHHDAEDHPRVCGEKHEAFEVVPYDTGITPACAGKSEKKVPFLPPHQDHPRVCGEKARSICRPLCKMGSPPRMRGKVSVHSAFSPFVRITPACAGKSRRLSHCRSQFWDHPRVCGEKLSLSTRPRAKSGSPPRVRGKVHISTGQVGGVGITPAYAGKRAVANFRPGTIRDHPRVCGEKTCLIMSSRFWMGSPPRMRGKVSSA